MASYLFEAYTGPNPEVLQIPEPEIAKQNGVRRPQQPKRFGRTQAQRRRDLSVHARGKRKVMDDAIERRELMSRVNEVHSLGIAVALDEWTWGDPDLFWAFEPIEVDPVNIV